LRLSCPRAVGPGSEAAEAITAVATAAAADRWHIAQGWLGARKPADAVRELLAAADPLSAWLRDAAATMAAMTGDDGLPAWLARRREKCGGVAEQRPHCPRPVAQL
jgi:dsDNA-binding SOS-regulon protein